MAKVQETVLKTNKSYKGGIKWVKLNINDKHYKVEKRRHFGWESYDISKNEYDWIKTPQQAAAMWDFVHYHGTASWFGGETKHPITGAVYQNEGANAERPAS